MSSFLAELKRRNVIRIALFYGAGAWLVLQVADVLLGIIEAPGGSLRLVALVLGLGFPFALVLAWAFEITPDGIRRDRDLAEDQRSSAEAGRRLNIATIVLLLLAIGLVSWNLFRTRTPSAPLPIAWETTAAAPEVPRDLSIAVLPFVNMSEDVANEYFSEGLSEELLNVLARMADFRVAGRTSSFAFKGQREDLRAIGERLRVANILEGSVRRQGDRVRVTAQLVDARTGYHLWSDTYDRRLDDIFAIQDDIATEVVRALRRALLPGDEVVISQTPKGDVDAYNHYLRGQFHARLRTPEGLARALEEFQQAVIIDPGYAPSYAGMAMVYALLDNYNYRGLEETGPLAYRALERALEIDPRSDEAWAVRGLLLGQGPGAPGRSAEARAALERAIEINPNNAFAHLWLSNTLLPDIAAAQAALQRAYAVDPLSPVIVYRQVMRALLAGHSAEIGRYLAELRQVAPEWFITWFAIGTVATQDGRVADGALAFERVRELNPGYTGAVMPEATALEMLGEAERAEALLRAVSGRQESDEWQVALAGHRARRAIAQHGLREGLSIYREVIERLPAPNSDWVAELALLEISAGDPGAAEARLRTFFGLGPGELPACDVGPDLVPCMALGIAMVRQGQAAHAAGVALRLRTLIAALRRQGIEDPGVALIEGSLGSLEGRHSELEQAAVTVIDKGWRVPVPVIRWLFTGYVDGAVVDRLAARMEQALDVERARYRALRGNERR